MNIFSPFLDAVASLVLTPVSKYDNDNVKVTGTILRRLIDIWPCSDYVSLILFLSFF